MQLRASLPLSLNGMLPTMPPVSPRFLHLSYGCDRKPASSRADRERFCNRKCPFVYAIPSRNNLGDGLRQDGELLTLQAILQYHSDKIAKWIGERPTI